MGERFAAEGFSGSRGRGVLPLVLALVLLAACGNETRDQGNPLGPSSSSPLITVTPSVVTVARGGTLTFTAKGGAGTFTWTLSDQTLGAINAATGAFTAGASSGTLTVTATDSNGITGTAAVTVSGQVLIVSPASAQVPLGGARTFTATGTAPLFWSLSNASLGNIGTTTGVFTANGSTGTGTVTVLDSLGNTGTASITVNAATILVSPSSLSLIQLPTATITFTATGNVGTLLWDLSGATNSYTGTAIATGTGVVTVTTMPTTAEGDQTLTITATDGIATAGTATLTLTAQ